MEKLVCVRDFELAATSRLDQNALEYYVSGADEEITLKENREGFKRIRIIPRMLRDVSSRTTETEVLGKQVKFPVGISPTALQKLAHDEGEVASAKAASKCGTIFIHSTIATTSVETVSKEVPNGRKWFQLYVYKKREVTKNLVHRAEQAGYEAIVLTVDTPYFGKRRANFREKFRLPDHLKLANFEAAGAEFSEALNTKSDSSSMKMLDQLMDQSLTWYDISWLKRVTKLPIIVKGILTPEDAELALQYGASGIFVSNHGARQLDTVYPTIEALPAIVDQVAGRCEIYLDGGVSSGSDVFKALAIGAKMVFLGRPVLWGLHVGGSQGVEKVLNILKNELDLTMALAGVRSVKELDKSFVKYPFILSNL